MLQIKDLHYSISDRQLLAGIDWVLPAKKRTALIGPNGTGKTTLLKILTGEIEQTGGTVAKPKDYRIGCLPQEEINVGSGTILGTVLAGQVEISALEQKIEKLHRSLDSANGSHETLLKQLGDLEQQYEALDGYHLEATAKNVLSGLGFRKSDFPRPLAEFSGGWRMRTYLALLLVKKPDLLLLDEPTNHLDLPSLEWLEQYLLGFPGSIILVSHDRFFIDRLAQEIVELEGGKLEHYSGNYHFYEEQKQQRRLLLEKKWREQQEEIARQERFITRFRAKNTKATQVQSRIKQLERMEKIAMVPPAPPPLEFSLNVGVRSYNDVLQIRDMAFRYDTEWVFRDLTFNLYRGERVALIGANGAGKTTLTRLISGQLKARAGLVQTGERVHIGYYAQHQAESLNLEATVYEEVSATAATNYLTEIRTVLGVFQFGGDTVNKKIKVLSGGEKARVSLAKILLSPVNFLIMDEPTNHLDKTAREALEHALAHYDGTMLLISHDRYFLDKLVQRIIELKDGTIEEYSGSYSYYLDKRENRSLPISPEISGGKNRQTPGGKKTKEQKRMEAEARQSISKEVNRLKNEIEQLEDKIANLENRFTEIETEMASPDTYRDKAFTVSLQKEYAAIKKELPIFNEKWEKTQLQYEKIKSRLS